jgi:hypothetical protein
MVQRSVDPCDRQASLPFDLTGVQSGSPAAPALSEVIRFQGCWPLHEHSASAAPMRDVKTTMHNLAYYWEWGLETRLQRYSAVQYLYGLMSSWIAC